jgi:8-oxo-dGTP pyrophosphatase MutT (NUDIX family)
MSTKEWSELERRLREALSGPLPGRAAHETMLPASRPSLAAQGEYLPSAVLVAIVAAPAGPSLLLIERAEGGPHGGQIAFPGGRAEEGDADLAATALREAREEIGLEPASVEVLGLLSPLGIAVSRYRVQPVVGLASGFAPLRANPAEVVAILEAPLAELTDPRSRSKREISVRGERLLVPCYLFGGLLVWGATAMILSELEAILSAGGRP